MTARGRIAAAALAGVLLCFASVASGQNGPGYEVVSSGPVLELRFHGIPLKSVRADDAQNALSLDFNQPVDGAVFDHLSGAMPQWIAMAYTSYDNGVIRATRPVTFLTRPETDGFSLRMVPRDGAPAAAPFAPAGAPYPAPAPGAPAYGPPPGEPRPMAPQSYGPPPPAQPQASSYAPYPAYAAARNFYGMEMALRRGDPMWSKAYERAAMQSASDVSVGTDYSRYHSGDAVIASHVSARAALGGGLALIGTLNDTDLKGDTVRAANGTFVTNMRTNLLSGSGGVAIDAWDDTEMTLEATAGNGLVGGRLNFYSGDPDNFILTRLSYHQPYLDTPQAVLADAFKDEGILGAAGRLGFGLSGALSGHFDNYGIHGNASTTKTAGWTAALHWDAVLGDGLSAGLAYDGQGDYRLDHVDLTGAAPTPYVPLSIRNLEAHAVTASFTGVAMGDSFWFDLFGGYINDRYSTDGALYGISMHYNPAPGVGLMLGARHSTVSLTQGEIGAETSVGLDLTLGIGGAPRAVHMFY